MAGHIFISYVREDAAIVDRLAMDLEAVGLEVWLDRKRLAPGERWRDAIRQAIRAGDLFIACFSHAFANRDRSHMHEELTLAIDELRLRPTERAWFIPVVLDEAEVPDRAISAAEGLRDIQWVNLHEDWRGGIERISQVALQHTNRASNQEAPNKVAIAGEIRRTRGRRRRLSYVPILGALLVVLLVALFYYEQANPAAEDEPPLTRTVVDTASSQATHAASDTSHTTPNITPASKPDAGSPSTSFDAQTIESSPSSLVLARPVSATLTVRTIVRFRGEVSGYEVWYVPRAFAHDDSRAMKFPALSSPTSVALPPGNYAIWAQKPGGPAPERKVIVAVVKDSSVNLDVAE